MNKPTSTELHSAMRAAVVTYEAAVDAMCTALDIRDADESAVEGCPLDLAVQAAVASVDQTRDAMESALAAYRAASAAELRACAAGCSQGNAL
jgi:hypothetical protein